MGFGIFPRFKKLGFISDVEDEFAYWQEEETKAEAKIESEEEDSEEENESFIARFC